VHCSICKEEKKLKWDNLCGRCHKAIGLFQRDPKLLKAAIGYLEKLAAQNYEKHGAFENAISK
jgi:hypothetical protein